MQLIKELHSKIIEEHHAGFLEGNTVLSKIFSGFLGVPFKG